MVIVMVIVVAVVIAINRVMVMSNGYGQRSWSSSLSCLSS